MHYRKYFMKNISYCTYIGTNLIEMDPILDPIPSCLPLEVDLFPVEVLLWSYLQCKSALGIYLSTLKPLLIGEIFPVCTIENPSMNPKYFHTFVLWYCRVQNDFCALQHHYYLIFEI